MLAEVAATDISVERHPSNFDESASVAKRVLKLPKPPVSELKRVQGNQQLAAKRLNYSDIKKYRS
ncbi:MAG: hypothetical protein LBS29_01925 [Endomicrobium sp.]|nr:hypothetical protein [Endomicrobium sp.]